jgi:hypothetical protein
MTACQNFLKIGCRVTSMVGADVGWKAGAAGQARRTIALRTRCLKRVSCALGDDVHVILRVVVDPVAGPVSTFR